MLLHFRYEKIVFRMKKRIIAITHQTHCENIVKKILTHKAIKNLNFNPELTKNVKSQFGKLTLDRYIK